MDCENKLLQDEIVLWRYINFILCIGLGSVSYLYINLENRYNQLLHSIVCNTLMHECYSSDDDSDYEPVESESSDSEEDDSDSEEDDDSDSEEDESVSDHEEEDKLETDHEEEDKLESDHEEEDINKETNCEVM